MPSVLFHFEDFVLDCARFELRQSGRRLRLEKIPMELLQRRYLQKAYQQRDAHLVYVQQDPALDALRSEPSFVAITRKMRLPGANVN